MGDPRTPRTPSTSSQRTTVLEFQALDAYWSHKGDVNYSDDLLLMERASANKPGRSFWWDVITLPADLPTDRPAGLWECTSPREPAAHGIARGLLGLLFFAGQTACITICFAYERCHNGITPPSDTALEACDSFESFTPHVLHLLTRTSTTMFVVSTLTHGVLAMQQYHLNRNDRYQDVCLGVGVSVGLIACLPSLADPAGRLTIVSTLTMAVTLALMASALGHFIVGLFYKTENAHSSVTDVSWVDEKSGMA